MAAPDNHILTPYCLCNHAFKARNTERKQKRNDNHSVYPLSKVRNMHLCKFKYHHATIIRHPLDHKSHDAERNTWGRIFHVQISLFNPEICIPEPD